MSFPSGVIRKFVVTCQGNFGPEKFGPGDQYSMEKIVPPDQLFHGISVLSWNLGPPCKIA